jgi:hypothetical protein
VRDGVYQCVSVCTAAISGGCEHCTAPPDSALCVACMAFLSTRCCVDGWSQLRVFPGAHGRRCALLRVQRGVAQELSYLDLRVAGAAVCLCVGVGGCGCGCGCGCGLRVPGSSGRHPYLLLLARNTLCMGSIVVGGRGGVCVVTLFG